MTDSAGLNHLRDLMYGNAVDKGFHEEDRSFGDDIALILTELGEVFEEHRDGHDFTEVYYSEDKRGNPKPEGIPIELADVVIRILDTCGKYGIDIEDAVVMKYLYNTTRPAKHGGKVL